MKKTIAKASFGAFLLLACMAGISGPGLASTFIIPPDDDLIVGARAIVKGKVLSIACGLDEQQNRIYTYVTLRVQDVIKGRISSRKIILKQEGGQLDDRGSIIFGTPQFKVGEQVLLYLDTWRDGSLRVYQMMLGKFSVVKDQQTGQQIVVRDLRALSAMVLRGQPHLSGSNNVSTDRMELSAYEEMVRARLAINRERAALFERTYYSDVPLLARPPDYTRVEKKGLKPQFVLFPSSSPGRWFEPDNGQPVVFMVNPDNAPNSEIMNDISAAMNAWSSVQGCSLRVVNGGTTNQCINGSDLSIVMFNNCDGRFSPTPGCASILALGGYNWYPGERIDINGTTFNRAVQGSISFNPYASCAFQDHCSVREITTHELGHALGLGHSQYPEATMFGTAHFDGRCASLTPDDVSGITYVYPVQNGGTGALSIQTNSPLPAGRLGTTYVQILAASGGSLPYSWSLAPGAGRVPLGLSFTTTGIISGLPIEQETASFTVRVTDSQGRTADKAFSLTISNGATGYDAQFVSHTVPTNLQPGQSFNVNIKWLNTGTETWDGLNGFRLGSQNPANNGTWGGDRVIPSNALVPPGQQLDITFTAFAPRTVGTYNFQWQLFKEGIGFFGQMSANVAVSVSEVSTPSIISPSTMEMVRGIPVGHGLTATGGTPPYAWQLAGGALPTGLGLNTSSGLISGTPTASGSFNLTIQVTDSASQTAQKSITINVNAPALEVTSAALPSVMKGTPYSHQLNATGGTGPYNWIVSAGGLPPGLSLVAAGMISGMPTAAGTFSFSVEVADAESRKAGKAFSIIIIPTPLAVEIATSLETLKGTSFNYLPAVTGGTPPYAWVITTGALPPGLSLSFLTGAISGIPSAGGTYNFSVSVRDDRSESITRLVQIKVVDPETIPRITSVKYKNKKRKLTVSGERIDPAAALFIDGLQTPAHFRPGSFEVKRLPLTDGRHEIKIVNPNGVPSQPYILNVD